MNKILILTLIVLFVNSSFASKTRNFVGKAGLEKIHFANPKTKSDSTTTNIQAK